MMMFMPQTVRKVARGEIQLHNNLYFSQDLQEYHGDELRVAYNIHNADFIWLFDEDGRFVCKAEWNGNKIDYMPKSFVEQAKDKRMDAQVKRLQTKISVAEAARPAKVLEHQQSVSLGGLVVDLAEVKAKAEAVLLPQAEPKADRPPEAQVDVPEQASWRVPATPQERIAEWHRLNEQPNISEAQQRWLTRYPQSHEFKALNRNVA